jgi:aminomethyltransferase
LAYNALRIRAGQPATGRELSKDYLPLEAGLWDEVSFTKGCYTGQEIIARMESRGRLAKTIVKLKLSKWIEAPKDLYFEGKPAGTLSSSVITPDDEILGIGFVKVSLAIPGQALETVGSDAKIIISELVGVQPPQSREA